MEIEAEKLQKTTQETISVPLRAKLLEHGTSSMSHDKNQPFGLFKIKNLSLKDGIKRMKR